MGETFQTSSEADEAPSEADEASPEANEASSEVNETPTTKVVFARSVARNEREYSFNPCIGVAG